jgi:RimJ/RimL family protein N-acetyltransferase
MQDLIGARVRVRGFQCEEWHAFWQAYVPDPMTDFHGAYHYDAKHCEKMFERAVERAAWYPSFGIFLPDGRPIGMLSLKRLVRGVRCELGVMLQCDAYKNQGYGTEAMRLLLDFAFAEYALRRIFADTRIDNLPMRHILPKLGFAYICRDRKYFKTPDGRVDRLNYVLVQKRRNMRLRDHRVFAALPAWIRNRRHVLYLWKTERRARIARADSTRKG